MKHHQTNTGSLFCSTNPFFGNRSSILVFNCFRTDLNVAWTIEYCHLAKKTEEQVNVEVFDLSIRNIVNESRPLVFLWQLIQKRQKSLPNFLKEWCFQNNLLYRRSKQVSLKYIWLACKNTPKLLLSSQPKTSSNNEFLDHLFRSTHSSMANALHTVHYIPFLHPGRIILRSLSFCRSFVAALQELKSGAYTGFIIPNGRFPAAAGVLCAATLHNMPVRLLERGGCPGMLNIFDQSPHSMAERRKALRRFVSQKSHIFPELLSAITQTYFENRRSLDSTSGVNWQKDAHLDISTELKRLANERRIVTFFTSTELEFAVFNEPKGARYHDNQASAVRSLTRALNPEDNLLVIRRHPQRRWSVWDHERRMWSKIRKSREIYWVGPKEPVNSYELGKASDVIAHFNSGIGPEFLFEGHPCVITLGPTPWLDDSSIFSCGNEEQILDALNSLSLDSDNTSASNWGLFQTLIGSVFQVIEWRNGKGYFEVLEITKWKYVANKDWRATGIESVGDRPE